MWILSFMEVFHVPCSVLPLTRAALIIFSFSIFVAIAHGTQFVLMIFGSVHLIIWFGLWKKKNATRSIYFTPTIFKSWMHSTRSKVGRTYAIYFQTNRTHMRIIIIIHNNALCKLEWNSFLRYSWLILDTHSHTWYTLELVHICSVIDFFLYLFSVLFLLISSRVHGQAGVVFC